MDDVNAQVTDTTTQDAPQATETAAPIQTDLQKIEAAITDLKAAGEALFTDEIATLEAKVADLKAKAEAEVKAVETKIVTAEQTFAQKYGQTFAHIIEIALLCVIAGKLLNLF